MKKFFMILALAAMTLTAGAQTDPKVWPWDFPQDVEIDAKAGQQALTNQDHYFDYVERGEGFEKKTMIWYNTTIVEPGQGKTTVLAYGNKKEVPNALVIPLGKSETAKKGDILLTCGNRNHDMARAIVVDDSTPTEPVVCFLDNDWDWPNQFDSPKVAEKQKGEKLKAGSFNVLKDGKFESGAQVAFDVNGKLKYGTIVQVSGDKVLIAAFANQLECTTKNKCKLISYKTKFKEGDKVRVVDVSSYELGYTVVKVDKEHGHLWAQKDENGKIYCFNLLTVMK
jgi:hypothetical protein